MNRDSNFNVLQESANCTSEAVATSPASIEKRRNIRLGVVTDRSAFVKDGLWVHASLGRLIDALRAKVSDLSLAISRADERAAGHSYRLDIPQSKTSLMPRNPSIARGFFNVRGCLKAIRSVERASDVVLVQMPFSASLALLAPRRPRVYQVCADILGTIGQSVHYSGVKRPLALAGSHFLDRVQKRLICRSDSRLVAHGEKLWKHYGTDRGRAVVSASMFADEILSANRTRPLDAPFRVLYAGYLRREKGIDVLCDAFRIVGEQLPSAELAIVGCNDSNDGGTERELQRQIEILSQRHVVRFLGHKQFGPDLFQCYADADVLIVPSRSEGTPRVLVEARAQGCPVIASCVGGIPTSITDETDGLLVPVGDASALADAVVRLAKDDDLRKRLIAAGIKRAQATTIETLAESILLEVEQVQPRPLERDRADAS